MRNLFLAISFTCLCTLGWSQIPPSFKYQAVVRDDGGKIVPGANVNLRITIIDSTTGTVEYVELHKTGTNPHGLFSVNVGKGIAQSGSFAGIPWQTGNIWMQVEMDATGGTAYTFMGISQLISVPYALMAGTAANVDDADANPTNEIQSLSLSGNTLSISGGNSITLPSGTVNTDSQNLSFSGSMLSIDNGNTIDLSSLIDDADANPANELNDSFAFDTTSKILSLTDAGGTITADLSSLSGGGGGGPDNDWTVNGNDMYNNNPGNVGIGNASPSEKLEVTGNVQFSGSLQPGSNAGTTGQFLISQGPGVPPIWQTATGSDDGDWTVAGDTMYNNNPGNIGIGTASPTAKLHIQGNDGVLATGTFGSGAAPATGAGTRMMWYPAKSAFRAGTVTGTNWDATNVGNYSFASGDNTKASAEKTTAMGSNTNATGQISTAFGLNTVAGGNVATAMGASTNAFGDRATSTGFFTNAVGDNSFTSGYLTIAHDQNTIAAGYMSNARGTESVALGNQTATNGKAAFAMGDSTIATGDNTTALGYHASTNNMSGSFVYGDKSTTTTMSASGANQFMVRATGGVTFYSSSSGAQGTWMGTTLLPGQSSFSIISDKHRKENFKTLDGEELLGKISSFKLGTWNYKGQDPAQFRHYGPMAQDFYAAFGNDGIGTIGNDCSIGTADLMGVNFTAIHALEHRTSGQQQKIDQLQQENETLKERLDKLEKKVKRLNKKSRNKSRGY